MNVAPAIESSSVPLYAQIKAILRKQIFDGIYQADARLPGESEMSRIFGVSRITVRQALGDLQREGYIFKVPGKGTYVSRTKAYQELASLEGFGEAMSRLGHEIRNEVISHRTVRPDETIAAQLRLPADIPVSEITRLRYLNREPVSLEVTYLPEAIGERLRGEDLERRDIFLILERDCRIPLGHADLQIDAVPADDALSHALQVDAGIPLLRIRRLTFTRNGMPLDFEYLYFRSDIFQYRLRLARHPRNDTDCHAHSSR